MAGTDHRHRFWRPTRAGQRGLALVMVLWTAVILALVAGSVTRLSRGDLQLVRNVTDATHAELAADAGLRRALYEIAAAPGTWRTDGGIYGWRFGDAELRVEVSDELGRIDINQASEALLAGLFDAAGAADPERIAAATTAYREARRTEAARVDYLERWLRTHVVREAPSDLEDHIIFCGPVHTLMCFLQPLMFANIEWDNGTDAPSRILPKVVVLDPHLDEREITYSEKDGASSRFEACTFYEPAADAAPTRLWIVAGDPRDSRCHSGRPSPLERCRVAKAACFVLPGNQATDEDSNLMGDDFAVRAVRNVQEVIARSRNTALDAAFDADEHCRPRLLIEMHDNRNSRYLRYDAPRGQLQSAGHIVEPTFLDSAVVNVYHSQAALPFTLHAMCSWRDDGLLYHERLRDGVVRESCHLSLVDIPKSFVNERYLKFFDYCNAHAALPIGLLRAPHGTSDRQLPYVYTTPRPYDYVYAGDKAYVLATSVWFGDHGDPLTHEEDELEACVKVATRRASAVFLPPPSEGDRTRGGTRRQSGLAV